jgi:hypothetical protein
MDKIPTDLDTWVEEQKTKALFTLRSAAVNVLEKFVQVGEANRQISPKQAQGLTYVRAMAARYHWRWAVDFCATVEDHQLTIGWPDNSRQQLLRAVRFEREMEHDKARGVVNLQTSGDSKS